MTYNNKELKQENTATEVLREVKTRAKRWMIAFFIVLVLWTGTIGTFVWYMYLHNF